MNLPFKFPSIFKIPTHKKFEYNPLYYKRQKDEEQENSLKSEPANSLNGRKHNIRFNSKFSSKNKSIHAHSKNIMASQLRVVAIILFLLAAAWYLLR